MAKQSRASRWEAAVQEARSAVDRMVEAAESLDLKEVATAAEAYSQAMSDLGSVQDEYRDWYEGMPESLQSGPTGEKLEEVTCVELVMEIDDDSLADAVRSAIEAVVADAVACLDDAEGVDLPLGFGKD